MSQRVLLVVKRSSYARFVEDEGDPRVARLLRQRDPSVARWLDAHRAHMATLEATERALAGLGVPVGRVGRADVAFDTADATLVVTVGGDGTLLAASHNVGAVPILGVNSAPAHSVGFFCAARRETVEAALRAALDGSAKRVVLQRMRVSVNGHVRARRVLNEALYCHASPAVTSRYIVSHGEVSEEHRSSGFWVGPPAGSTAAQRSAGGRVLPLQGTALQLVVREPYAPPGVRYRLLRTLVPAGDHLGVKSKMRDARLFLDGPQREIPIRLGDTTVFELSSEPLTVLGLSRRRQR